MIEAILQLEDSPEEAEIIRDSFLDYLPEYAEYFIARDKAEFQETTHKLRKFSLIIVDLDLGSSSLDSGLAILKAIEQVKSVPFAILSGHIPSFILEYANSSAEFQRRCIAQKTKEQFYMNKDEIVFEILDEASRYYEKELSAIAPTTIVVNFDHRQLLEFISRFASISYADTALDDIAGFLAEGNKEKISQLRTALDRIAQGKGDMSVKGLKKKIYEGKVGGSKFYFRTYYRDIGGKYELIRVETKNNQQAVIRWFRENYDPID